MNTKNFTPESTINEIVQEDVHRAALFDELGLDFCCGGAKPLKDACRERDLDPEEILEKISSLDNESLPPPATDLQDISTTELVDHIESTHHEYIKSATPGLLELAKKVAGVHGDRRPELTELKEKVMALAEDLGPHLMKEERVLFPLIRKLEGSLKNGGMIEGPISVMKMEHDHVGRLLQQIDRLSGKYTVPSDGCESYRTYMEKLKEFVEDLRLHIHKENNILFARITG
ncbi:MAG: iron-sulfur cluster repair di-iron protein [Nitrospinae bacterium]|nr:iron-sulfur cluster repair di-iron protein [Nitrospinota bacterium]